MPRSSPLVYIAGPLFNESERAFNVRLCDLVESMGFRSFLPQREAGDAAARISRGEPPDVVRSEIFELDWTAVRDCDMLLLVLDGRVPDEGGCVELGMAFALGKPCIGFQTDSRRFSGGFNNAMIDGCLKGRTASDWDGLGRLLEHQLNSSGFGL